MRFPVRSVACSTSGVVRAGLLRGFARPGRPGSLGSSCIRRQPEEHAELLDEVKTGRIEDTLALVEGPFDTVLLYDVLEHLPDPAAVLVALQDVALPGTRLHVSVPNARHWSLFRDLVLRGTFAYSDSGHRDTTHLRWFTRSDIEQLLRATGWTPVVGSHPALKARHARVHDLTRARIAEFTFWQWVVLAHRDEGEQNRLTCPDYGRVAEPSVSAK